jgi:hypothetical protein
MLVGSALSFSSGRSEAKKMRREMRAQRKLARDQLNFAKGQWKHYRETYGDIEQLMVADATEGVTADYDGVTSRAAADVEGQFQNQADRQRRQMMAYGLDPSSGRYQSSDRQMGLDLATTKAQGVNAAREGERRYSRDATWQRRSQVGQFGAGLMQNAGRDVQAAQNNLATLSGQRAQMHGNMSNNLFAQAGNMAVQGLAFGADNNWGRNGGGSEFMQTDGGGNYQFDSQIAGEFGLGGGSGMWDAGVDPSFSGAQTGWASSGMNYYPAPGVPQRQNPFGGGLQLNSTQY